MSRAISASGLIWRPDGSVLLVHHGYGPRNWELPGGSSEGGEPIVDTVIREVREETGLAVVPSLLRGVYYEPSSDQHHFLFDCSTSDHQPARPGLPEISECTYWRIDALPRPISDFTIRRIQDGLGEPLSLPVEIPNRVYLF